MASRAMSLVVDLIGKYEKMLDTAQAYIPAPVAVDISSEERKEDSRLANENATKLKSTLPAVEKKAEPEVDLSKAPYELFPLIDIRVGRMVECWKHPSSDYLYCERIDIGEGQPREIGSGLQNDVPIEEMKDDVLVMANLKPRKLGGFNSNGMVLCLLAANEKFKIIRPGEVEPGVRVGLEGILEPGKCPLLPIMNPKKKIFEKAAPYFTTDADGYACFGEKRFLTTLGYIKTVDPYSKIS